MGETVQHLARYCLVAFSEALGIGRPVDRPAARAAAITRRIKPTKTAEGIPFALIRKLEQLASDTNQAEGLQLAASLFFLMIMASLRFADIRDVLEIWTADSAFCAGPLIARIRPGPSCLGRQPYRDCQLAGNGPFRF